MMSQYIPSGIYGKFCVLSCHRSVCYFNIKDVPFLHLDVIVRFEFKILWPFIYFLPQKGDVLWNLNTCAMHELPWTFRTQEQSNRVLVKSRSGSLEFSDVVEMQTQSRALSSFHSESLSRPNNSYLNATKGCSCLVTFKFNIFPCRINSILPSHARTFFNKIVFTLCSAD